MLLQPTAAEITNLLRDSGGLRDGHFEYSNGIHTNQHVDPALAMRSYENAKILTVALSRRIRAHADLRTILSDVSIVAATQNGLQVAYGLSYVLSPRRVFWAEKPGADVPMAFRKYTEPDRGEKIILVDDILRSGLLLAEAKALIEQYGAEVLAMAVIASQPNPKTIRFGSLPIYSLVELEPRVYVDRDSCELCRAGVPATPIGHAWKSDEITAAGAAV